MKRMWSVLTGPYLVLTVLPSTSGKRSRCTPPRDTSGPPPPVWLMPCGPATLSISSMKTMPADCTRSRASRVTVSWSTRRAASSCSRTVRASGSRSLRFFVFLPNGRLESMSCRLSPISSSPWLPKTCMVAVPRSETSTSTVRSSRPPARNIPRSFSRVPSRRGSPTANPVAPPEGGAALEGKSRSSSRSSAASRALPCTSRCFSSRTRATPCSMRSRIIESTSRPT